MSYLDDALPWDWDESVCVICGDEIELDADPDEDTCLFCRLGA